MFIGEFLCFVVYWIWRRWSDDGRVSVPVPVSKWFLFIVPAVCDLIATSTMYIALNLTYASSFQMLRGNSRTQSFNCKKKKWLSSPLLSIFPSPSDSSHSPACRTVAPKTSWRVWMTMEVVATTGLLELSRAKLQSNRHHQQTNIQLFYRP